MFFIAEKTGNFRIQLVGNITFQSPVSRFLQGGETAPLIF